LACVARLALAGACTCCRFGWMPAVYKPETYEVVSKWMEETPIKYGPNTKRCPSKSYDRYDGYAKAKTVGEALALKSKPEDLLFDYEHGHLTPLGGPVREAAIDFSSIADVSKLTKTDRVVSKWAGWGYRDTDETRQFVRQNKDGSFYVVTLDYTAEGRKEANTEAERILKEAKEQKRKIRECEVLRVLRLWRFNKNIARLNVMQEGQTFVFSDTLGLSRSRDGRFLEKEATKDHPDVTRLLCQWVKDHPVPGCDRDMPFTSINVNFKYAARRHRDSNNHGLSLIKALGKFSGGRLGYFPNDDQAIARETLDQLPESDRIFVNLKENFALFNGSCAHEVEDYEGERYSLVFFSMAGYEKTPTEVRDFLIDCGISWPDEETVELVKELLRPPRGYENITQTELVPDSRPGLLTWPAVPAELEEADAEPLPTKESNSTATLGMTSSEAVRAKMKARKEGKLAGEAADAEGAGKSEAEEKAKEADAAAGTPAKKRGRAGTAAPVRETPEKQNPEEPAAKRLSKADQEAVKRKSSSDGGTSKKPKKDPQAPKWPAGGAYQCWLAKHRDAFNKECEGKGVTAICKLAGERWKELSVEERKPFEEEYEAKKAVYHEAMKHYNEAKKAAYQESLKNGTPPANMSENKQTPNKVSGEKREVSRKAATKETSQPQLEAAVASLAEKAGLGAVLLRLIARQDIIESGKSQTDVFEALEKNGGLLHPTRRALLGE